MNELPVGSNKTARNERVKVTATWLNGAAIAAIAIGCFAPITASFTGTIHVARDAPNLLVGGWILLSVALHIVARVVLGRIEE